MAARFNSKVSIKPKSRTGLHDKTYASIRDTLRRKNKEKDAEKIVTEW